MALHVFTHQKKTNKHDLCSQPVLALIFHDFGHRFRLNFGTLLLSFSCFFAVDLLRSLGVVFEMLFDVVGFPRQNGARKRPAQVWRRLASLPKCAFRRQNRCRGFIFQLCEWNIQFSNASTPFYALCLTLSASHRHANCKTHQPKHTEFSSGGTAACRAKDKLTNGPAVVALNAESPTRAFSKRLTSKLVAK